MSTGQTVLYGSNELISDHFDRTAELAIAEKYLVPFLEKLM